MKLSSTVASEKERLREILQGLNITLIYFPRQVTTSKAQYLDKERKGEN
jgi:hypothetical protein